MHKEIGNNFKQLRNSLGKTQSDAAAALDVTFQQIQKYENGSNRLTLSNAINICNNFNVSLDTLTGGLLNDVPPADMPSPKERKLLDAIRSVGVK